MWRRIELLRSRGGHARPGTNKGTFGSPFLTSDPDQLGLLDPITLQALGTDPDPLGRAVDQDAHRLQIGIPAPLGAIVGVADVVAGDRPFGAHGADPCHKLHPCIMSDPRARKHNEAGR